MATLPPDRSVRILEDKDVRALLPVEPLMELMASALAEFSAGAVVNPLRTVLYAGNDRSYVGIMPAFLPAEQALGTKIVTAFGQNKHRGLPSHFATIVLLDSATGALRAVVDGRYITEMRTAAVSAVACRCLAREPISRVAVLGVGVQARGHLHVLDRTLPLTEVRLWSPGDGLDRLIAESRHLRASVVRASTAEEAVLGAEAVILVTDSHDPVVQDRWISPGTLLVSVGACRPDHREIDPALLGRAWLIVDSLRSALAESGDVIHGLNEQRFGPSHIRGENRRSHPRSCSAAGVGPGCRDLQVAGAGGRGRCRREPGVSARRRAGAGPPGDVLMLTRNAMSRVGWGCQCRSGSSRRC